jgi:hypothetical protein
MKVGTLVTQLPILGLICGGIRFLPRANFRLLPKEAVMVLTTLIIIIIAFI